MSKVQLFNFLSNVRLFSFFSLTLIRLTEVLNGIGRAVREYAEQQIREDEKNNLPV